MLTCLLAAVALALMPPLPDPATNPSSASLYIGTYTGAGQGLGVYYSKLDTMTGVLSEPEVAAKIDNASFLAVHPTLPVLYAVSENYGAGGGQLHAFAISPDSTLTLLAMLSTKDAGPCYVNASEHAAAVAHYGAGSVASFKLDAKGVPVALASLVKHEGSSVNKSRQKEPHAHSIVFAPGGDFALAADLGTDEVIIYEVDSSTGASSGVLKRTGQLKMEPGSGPRHIAFAPAGDVVFVVNELSNTVVASTWKHGSLSQIASCSTLPAGFTGESTTAEIAVHPNGNFVYASNRGHDSIAVMSFDGVELKLIETTPTQGQKPRHFAIDPSGQFLIAANQQTGNLVVFRIDQTTGGLTPTGSTVKLPAPVCVRFVR